LTFLGVGASEEKPLGMTTRVDIILQKHVVLLIRFLKDRE